MTTAAEIVASLKTSTNHLYQVRPQHGRRGLTLSFRPGTGYRYYGSYRPGGGGRKHTPCTQAEAIRLVAGIAKPKP